MTTEERERHQATLMYRRAIHNGALIRPSECERCGVTCTPHGHHHNGYGPGHELDVQWLCVSCHNTVHAGPVGARVANGRRTPEERSALATKAARVGASKGGRARALKLSAEQLTAIAYTGAAKGGCTRWHGSACGCWAVAK